MMQHLSYLIRLCSARRKFRRTLFGLWLPLAVLTACTDEDFQSFSSVPASTESRAEGVTGPLSQNENGEWVATKRVPLVGEGRIIDDFSSALVQVINTDKKIGNLLDTDLNNYAQLGSVANVQAIRNQLVSVRDINRVYAAGQEVGFVYALPEDKLLTAKVLSGFWIATYLDGIQQEMKGGKGDGETLELNLLSVGNNNGKQTISITAEKPFDEVKMGIQGVADADVLGVAGSIQLYYAFVGENAMKPSTPTYFPKVQIHEDKGLENNWLSGVTAKDAQNLVNESTEDNLVVVDFLQPHFTVHFGEDIPVGSEIGYVTESFSLLELSLLASTKLITFDQNDQEKESYKVGSLLGVSLIGGGKSTISMVTKEPCSQIKYSRKGISVDLGSKHFYYAFVREPVTVDASAYFTLPPELTLYTSSYPFRKPQAGTVLFTVTTQPEGATANIDAEGKLSGMTVAGDYTITATYTATDDTQLVHTLVIHRKFPPEQDTGCYNLIDRNKFPQAAIARTATDGPPPSGRLLCLAEGTGKPGNVIDEDPNNYAVAYNVLSLASNTLIIPVSTGSEDINSEQKAMRVGFTLQANNEFLGLDALKFFYFKLYKDGAQVGENLVPDQNSTVNVGLINGGEQTRMRMSATTTETFDAIELWTGGVLNLNLNSFRIYNAFYEPVDECQNIQSSAEACIEMVSNSAHGAIVHYDAMGPEGIGTVNQFTDLYKILDADKETGATIYSLLNIGSMAVPVTFDEMPAHQTIGFIIRDQNGVLGANVIDVTTLTTYCKGAKIQSSSEGGLLNLNVISHEGQEYVEMTPTMSYDEVRIAFSGITATKDLFIDGVFTRRDTDGDGIPDCAEDPNEEEGGDGEGGSAIQVELSLKAADICVGDALSIGAILYAEGTSDSDTEYILLCTSDKESIRQTVKITEGKLVFTGTPSSLPAGMYALRLFEKGEPEGELGALISKDALLLTVHPDETTWKPEATNNNWNDWDNWTNGTPWTCTNVILPGGCRFYPILDKDDYDNGRNRCHYLYLRSGAELVKSFYLNEYAGVWIDHDIASGQYHLLSAPLKGVISGDMFYAPGDPWATGNWQAIDNTCYPEDRFNPIFYQRLWSHEAPVQQTETESGTVQPDVTHWTPPYNALTQPYEAGMGFSLMAGTEKRTSYTLKFPKTHDTYHYYSLDEQPQIAVSGLHAEATGKSGGRFIYESENADTDFALPYTVRLTNQQEGTVFLAGNPFMAHINLAAFLTVNKDRVAGVKVFDAATHTNNSLILADGELLSSADGGVQVIRPMEAFFVVARTAGTELDIDYTDPMLVQQPAGTPGARSARLETPTLRLTATNHQGISSCVVVQSAQASDAFRHGEDAEVLMDNDASPGLAVYTLADGHALDIQQIHAATRMALGFRMKQKGDVTLRLETDRPERWKDWALVDSLTHRTYPLPAEVRLPQVSTGNERFYLQKK